jgi:hypothetical protein
MVQRRKNQANGYKVKLKRRGKAKQKVKKSKEKMREKRTPPQKLNFGRALVGLCLWRSTATYSITRDMAAPPFDARCRWCGGRGRGRGRERGRVKLLKEG